MAWRVPVKKTCLPLGFLIQCIIVYKILTMNQHHVGESMPSGNTSGHYAEAANKQNPPTGETGVVKNDTRIYVYPVGGTGESVDTSGQFDESSFNRMCIDNRSLRAVLPIYSATGNFDSRTMLRKTLGRWAENLNCKIFFIVGMSKDQEINEKLKAEYSKENDILIVGKIDTYRDLNNKAVAMIRWVHTYCSHIPYVIHLIDDAYMNLDLFLKRLDSINNENYILGTWVDTPSERRHWLFKSFVTKEEYPYERFPIYAYGFAFAFPGQVAGRLLSAIHNATYCWIEDVWIAGHVRESARVTLIKLDESEWTRVQRSETPSPEKLSKYFIAHSVTPDVMEKAFSLHL